MKTLLRILALSAIAAAAVAGYLFLAFSHMGAKGVSGEAEIAYLTYLLVLIWLAICLCNGFAARNTIAFGRWLIRSPKKGAALMAAVFALLWAGGFVQRTVQDPKPVHIAAPCPKPTAQAPLVEAPVASPQDPFLRGLEEPEFVAAPTPSPPQPFALTFEEAQRLALPAGYQGHFLWSRPDDAYSGRDMLFRDHEMLQEDDLGQVAGFVSLALTSGAAEKGAQWRETFRQEPNHASGPIWQNRFRLYDAPGGKQKGWGVLLADPRIPTTGFEVIGYAVYGPRNSETEPMIVDMHKHLYDTQPFIPIAAIEGEWLKLRGAPTRWFRATEIGGSFDAAVIPFGDALLTHSQLVTADGAPIRIYTTPNEQAEHLSDQAEASGSFRPITRDGDWLKIELHTEDVAMCAEGKGRSGWIRWRTPAGAHTVRPDDRYSCG